MKRMIALGVHSCSFPDNPAMIGLPSLHDEQWRSLWELCNDNKVVLSAHIGTGSHAAHASDLSPISSRITSMPITIANGAAAVLFESFWKDVHALNTALGAVARREGREGVSSVRTRESAGQKKK